MGVELIGSGYRIWIPHDMPDDPQGDENADIHVYLGDGSHYAGTLYTIGNIRRLMDRNAESGECACGQYMFDPTMLIIRDLCAKTIQAVIEDLINTGELAQVFVRS